MVNVGFPRFMNPSNYIVICVPLKPTGEVGLIGTCQAAKRQVERELIAQIQSYAKDLRLKTPRCDAHHVWKNRITKKSPHFGDPVL